MGFSDDQYDPAGENIDPTMNQPMVVEVMPEWSALRGTVSYDAFRTGDYVALRK